MKIIITEEKSSKLTDKLNKIKEFVEDVCEMLEDGKEEIEEPYMARAPRRNEEDDDDYDYEDEMPRKRIRRKMIRSRY